MYATAAVCFSQRVCLFFSFVIPELGSYIT